MRDFLDYAICVAMAVALYFHLVVNSVAEVI